MSGEDPPVRPPWERFKDAEPMWSGWRQGIGEDWLHRVWLPFWCGLSQEACDSYLRTWPPPGSEWRTQLQLWRK